MDDRARPFVVGPREGRFIDLGEFGMTVKATSEDTAGVVSVLEADEPAGFGPPLHVHEDAAEAFYVLEGEYLMQLEDEEIVCPAGSFVFIPQGVRHVFRVGGVRSRKLNFYFPAAMIGYFDELAAALRRDHVDEAELAQIARRHAMQITGPSPTTTSDCAVARAARGCYRNRTGPSASDRRAMRTTATNPWIVLVLICLAQFMVILDATIVNVALPSIQEDLELSEANLQWIINAYTLVFGGFLLLGGRLGDLLGRKRLFLVGLVIFTVASLLDGLAQSEGMLIGSRALQGLGAALISPAALSIISTTFEEGAERAKALGVWAAIAIGGSAVGLILGGVLTQAFSWPWIFFVNVPVGIVAFFFSLRLVPESRDEQAQRSYDVGGAVTVTGGLMALVYAIVKAETAGWTSSTTIAFFVLSAILLAAFLVIELRHPAPLVRLSIFRIRSLSTANIVMLLVASGMFAMFFFNTLYIQRVLGYGPLEAGLAFLPFTAGIMVSAGVASKLATTVGVRIVAAVGMVLTVIGMGLLTQLPVDGTYVADVLPSIVVSSLGMGAVFMPLTLVATTGLRDEDQGLASGLFNTSQQIGGALGLAILSTLAASKTASAGGADDPAALVTGFHWAFGGGAVFVTAALVVMLAMLRREHVAKIETQAAEPITVTV